MSTNEEFRASILEQIEQAKAISFSGLHRVSNEINQVFDQLRTNVERLIIDRLLTQQPQSPSNESSSNNFDRSTEENHAESSDINSISAVPTGPANSECSGEPLKQLPSFLPYRSDGDNLDGITQDNPNEATTLGEHVANFNMANKSGNNENIQKQIIVKEEEEDMIERQIEELLCQSHCIEEPLNLVISSDIHFQNSNESLIYPEKFQSDQQQISLQNGELDQNITRSGNFILPNESNNLSSHNEELSNQPLSHSFDQQQLSGNSELVNCVDPSCDCRLKKQSLFAVSQKSAFEIPKNIANYSNEIPNCSSADHQEINSNFLNLPSLDTQANMLQPNSNDELSPVISRQISSKFNSDNSNNSENTQSKVNIKSEPVSPSVNDTSGINESSEMHSNEHFNSTTEANSCLNMSIDQSGNFFTSSAIENRGIETVSECNEVCDPSTSNVSSNIKTISEVSSEPSSLVREINSITTDENMQFANAEKLTDLSNVKLKSTVSLSSIPNNSDVPTLLPLALIKEELVDETTTVVIDNSVNMNDENLAQESSIAAVVEPTHIHPFDELKAQTQEPTSEIGDSVSTFLRSLRRNVSQSSDDNNTSVEESAIIFDNSTAIEDATDNSQQVSNVDTSSKEIISNLNSELTAQQTNKSSQLCSPNSTTSSNDQAINRNSFPDLSNQSGPNPHDHNNDHSYSSISDDPDCKLSSTQESGSCNNSKQGAFNLIINENSAFDKVTPSLQSSQISESKISTPIKSESIISKYSVANSFDSPECSNSSEGPQREGLDLAFDRSSDACSEISFPKDGSELSQLPLTPTSPLKNDSFVANQQVDPKILEKFSSELELDQTGEESSLELKETIGNVSMAKGIDLGCTLKADSESGLSTNEGDTSDLHQSESTDNSSNADDIDKSDSKSLSKLKQKRSDQYRKNDTSRQKSSSFSSLSQESVNSDYCDSPRSVASKSSVVDDELVLPLNNSKANRNARQQTKSSSSNRERIHFPDEPTKINSPKFSREVANRIYSDKSTSSIHEPSTNRSNVASVQKSSQRDRNCVRKARPITPSMSNDEKDENSKISNVLDRLGLKRTISHESIVCPNDNDQLVSVTIQNADRLSSKKAKNAVRIERKFSNPDAQLTMHQPIGSRVSAFTCDQCQQSFQQKRLYDQHIVLCQSLSSLHKRMQPVPEKTVHVCPYENCDFIANTRPELGAHERKHREQQQQEEKIKRKQNNDSGGDLRALLEKRRKSRPIDQPNPSAALETRAVKLGRLQAPEGDQAVRSVSLDGGQYNAEFDYNLGPFYNEAVHFALDRVGVASNQLAIPTVTVNVGARFKCPYNSVGCPFSANSTAELNLHMDFQHSDQ